MLEDGKRLFEDGASVIDGWENMTKQQLADMYVDNENDKKIKNGCFSALSAKSWNLIGSNYIKNTMCTSPEDCYDILMDSLIYVLDKRVWRDENSKLFGDPKAFDKALGRRIKSIRLNKYIEAMRQKNRLNYTSYSIDGIIENYGDVFFSDDEIKINPVEDFSDNIIIDSFNKKRYFKSFLFDIIANADVFNRNDRGELEFSYKRTCKNLRNLDNVYCDYFSCRYSIPISEISKAAKIVSEIDTDRMKVLIDREFRQCRHDKLIKSLKETKC